MRIFSEKVMFLEISTSSDRPVPLNSYPGEKNNWHTQQVFRSKEKVWRKKIHAYKKGPKDITENLNNTHIWSFYLEKASIAVVNLLKNTEYE